MKIEKLVEILEKVEDPRRQWGNKRHKLNDVLIIGLCTIICGGEDFTDMETFGLERLEWLNGFLELPNGIPDSDTFRRIFERINPEILSECLRDWLSITAEKGSVVSIDGKTIRGSKGAGHKAYHVVSAFVRENALTLGEVKVDEKSNEITAVPELLDMLDIEGAIVTADAMSCQREIVTKITEKKANYALAVKGNQPLLLQDIADYFAMDDKKCTIAETKEKGHGRIEHRIYQLSTDIDWLESQNNWANLQGIGAVHSKVFENGIETTATRYFITSLCDISEFSKAVREHWGIENQLHWCLDVAFREDASRAKKDFSPLNLNVLRKIALPLLKAADMGRMGLQKKMFKAALSLPVLEYVLTGKK